jgi:hypothetical protein
VAFDGALAIVLVLAGAIVALAGLGVLFGRMAEEVAAVAAVAAGLALAALPFLPAPSDPEPPPEPVAAAPGVVLIAPDGRRTVAAAPPPAPAPLLPGREAVRIAIEGREAEPNDTLASANAAALGVAIDGELGPSDRDWFAFDVPRETRGVLVANLVTEDASVTLALFDDAGQTLGLAATLNEIRVRSASLERRLDRPRFYVRVIPTDDVVARYQLTVAARRR